MNSRNISNGYSAIFKIEIAKSKDIRIIPANIHLQKSKDYYRKAINTIIDSDPIFKCLLWTNYGNVLDHLGRSVESFFAYDRALSYNPKFSMAIANKAEAQRGFAEITGTYRAATYINCYQMIKSVLDKPDLIEYGGQSAHDDFLRKLNIIESLFKDPASLTKEIKHPPYNFKKHSDFERFYIEYSLDNNLFLNLHIHEGNCNASVGDPLFITLITPVDENNLFYHLSKFINQIKEDYAVARLLLIQSQYKTKDLTKISNLTTFVNTLDYSDFNIYIGLLKSAFKNAYSILDKISHFLNEYLNLNILHNIYFTTIWEEKTNNKKSIRNEIMQTENLSLFALYDIYLDCKSYYYSKIQDIRNALMHEKLTVYDSVLTDWDNKDDKYNIGYDSFLSHTLILFNVVRASIFYLINFVYQNEKKKYPDDVGLIVPQYVDTTQFI